MIELSDKEIQSLIDARAVLNKINAHPYVINRLDKILDDIYEGWISHIRRGNYEII